VLNLNHTLLTNDSALLLTQGNFTQCIETVSFDGAIINVTGTAAQQLANALVRWGTKTIRFLGENSIISDDFLKCLSDVIPHSAISKIQLPSISRHQQARYEIYAKLMEKDPNTSMHLMNNCVLLDEGALLLAQAKLPNKLEYFVWYGDEIQLSAEVSRTFIDTLKNWCIQPRVRYGAILHFRTSKINHAFTQYLFEVFPHAHQLDIARPPKRLLDVISEGNNYLQMAVNYLQLDGSLGVDEENMDLIHQLSLFLAQSACKQAIETANGAELLVFFGATGAGKSALLNHFFGSHYESTGTHPTNIKLIHKANSALEKVKVGHNHWESETLIPAVFVYEDKAYQLADFAGLFDSRGDDIKLFEMSAAKQQ